MSKNKILLMCGLAASLYYTAMNIFIPMLFEGYDSVTQTVSELSAIDAPTRTLWVILAVIYVLLFGAFGWGVKLSANGNKFLKTTGNLILIYTLINIYWPPMHLRGNEPTLTDTLHIVWALVTVLLMMLIMGFGAAALGKSFRIYTVLTFLTFIVFGILIGVEAPGISENLPTPYIGIWERINIGVFMLWVIVLSIVLVGKEERLNPRNKLQKQKEYDRLILN